MNSNSFSPLTIVAFGDSITSAGHVVPELRWPALVEAELSRQFPQRSITVFNEGVGGNTSREGLARIEDVTGHNPDIVLAEFGGNDATREGERHVALDEYVTNLGTIEKHASDAGASLVLLTFPPCVDTKSAAAAESESILYVSDDDAVELYRAKTREYAASQGLVLIDIDRALRQAAAKGGWQPYFQTDGVHLTEGGNQVVADCVGAGLLKILSAA